MPTDNRTVVYRLQSKYSDCEDCGLFEDWTLTVILNGEEIGRFYEDGHLGHSRIDLMEVEKIVVTAINLPSDAYEGMKSERAEMKRLQQKAWEESDFEKFLFLEDPLAEKFFAFLRIHGYTVQEVVDEYAFPLLYQRFEI